MVLASTIAPSVNTNSLTSSLYMLGSPVFWILGSAPISTTSIPRPSYHYILPIYGLITILLYLFSTRLIRPIRRWQMSWSEFLIPFLVVLGFLSLVSLGFVATTNRYENIILAPTPTPPAELLPIDPKMETPTPIPSGTETAPSSDPTETPEAFGWQDPQLAGLYEMTNSFQDLQLISNL